MFWSVYGLLLSASAIVGVCLGLAAVYGVGLPRIDDFESYRPASDTLLYDDEGRVPYAPSRYAQYSLFDTSTRCFRALDFW